MQAQDNLSLMTWKKKIKTILYSIVTAIFLFVLSLAATILYPESLFANKLEYRQFKVYSNGKIGDEIRPILDSAISLVKKSELYDSTYKVDVFFAYGTFFNKVDTKIFGEGPVARSIDNNLVVKVKIDMNKNLAYATFHKPCQQNFSYVIAHEMVHCLQANKYGILKFNPFSHPEMWKLEGYPEFVAKGNFSNPDYNLREEIEKFVARKCKEAGIWISTDGGCDVPEFYYKGELMTEYLISVTRLSYDQILNDKRSEEQVYAEMVKWANGE